MKAGNWIVAEIEENGEAGIIATMMNDYHANYHTKAKRIILAGCTERTAKSRAHCEAIMARIK